MTVWRWPEFFSACNFMAELNEEQKKIADKQDTSSKGGSYVQSLKQVGMLKNGN